MKLAFKIIFGGLLCAVITAAFAMFLTCSSGSSAYCGLGAAIVALISAPIAFVAGAVLIGANQPSQPRKLLKTSKTKGQQTSKLYVPATCSEQQWVWITIGFVLIAYLVPSAVIGFLVH